VLHPVSDEIADLPGIELDHDLDPNFAVRRNHESPDVFGQIKAVRGLFEVKVGRLKGLHQSAIPRIN
jgi:hypothetical protein